ncbi:MAG TPA: hypothetical protein VLA87_00455 [Gaiellaceae bacterium]|nr:hypothetical protein [Gaiellaceae bacterium]
MPDLDSTALAAAHRAVQEAAMQFLVNPRVSLVDFGYRIRDQEGFRVTDEHCLRIHLRDKPRGEQLESLEAQRPELYLREDELLALTARHGFPVDLPLGDYRPSSAVGGYAPVAAPPEWAPPRRDRALDPMLGGISVGNAWIPGAGTLGGKVVDRRGTPLLLSNWHVLSGRWWIGAGAPVCQPGRLDGGSTGDVVAHLARDAWRSGLDAAVATLATGSRRLVNDQLGLGPVTGSATPAPLMRVTKSGRTTGLTWGIVTSILPGRMFSYPDGFPRAVRDIWVIEPELELDRVSGSGDSGSWWLDADSRRAVGLHFAGERVPSRALALGMPTVLEALDVQIAVT